MIFPRFSIARACSAGPTMWNEPNTTTRSPGRASCDARRVAAATSPASSTGARRAPSRAAVARRRARAAGSSVQAPNDRPAARVRRAPPRHPCLRACPPPRWCGRLRRARSSAANTAAAASLWATSSIHSTAPGTICKRPGRARCAVRAATRAASGTRGAHSSCSAVSALAALRYWIAPVSAGAGSARVNEGARTQVIPGAVRAGCAS